MPIQKVQLVGKYVPSARVARGGVPFGGGLRCGLRCVGGVTWNAAGDNAGYDEQCDNESEFTMDHHQPPLISLLISGAFMIFKVAQRPSARSFQGVEKFLFGDLPIIDGIQTYFINRCTFPWGVGVSSHKNLTIKRCPCGNGPSTLNIWSFMLSTYERFFSLIGGIRL